MPTKKLVCPKCGLNILDLNNRGDLPLALTHCDLIFLKASNAKPISTEGRAYSVLQSSGLVNIEKIGEGYNAVVFSARELNLGRPVAVKLTKSFDTNAVALGLQSARKIANIHHPNIPPIHYLGYLEDVDTDQRYPVVVMQLAEGLPLSSIPSSSFVSGLYDPISLFLSICQTLQYCHERGVYHGDLVNFENIIVSPASEAFVIDFGYSRRLSGENQHAFNFRKHDLTAVVAIARYLFSAQIDLDVQGDESLEHVIASVEQALRATWARHSYLYSQQKRFDFVKQRKSTAAHYRLRRYRTVQTIYSPEMTHVEIEMYLEPFEPIEHLNFGFFGPSKDLSDLAVRAWCQYQSSEVAVPVEVDAKDSSGDGTIVLVKLLLPEAIVEASKVRIMRPSSGLDPKADAFSFDTMTFCSELEIVFRFLDSEVPRTWRSSISVYGEQRPTLPKDEWLYMDEDKGVVTCRFRHLSPFMSLEIQFDS